MIDVTVVVAGEAGQGVQSAASALTRLFQQAGYNVFACPDVESRIRGGHNFTRIRVSDQLVRAPVDKANILLALDKRSIAIHRERMIEDGVIVYEGNSSDSNTAGSLSGHDGRVQFAGIPLRELAAKHGDAKVLSGVVALGAVAALIGQPQAALERVLAEEFGRKGKQAVKANTACVRAGFAAVEGILTKECPCRISAMDRPEPRMLLTGNQAVALGALAAGVRFYAGYPMSPSTGIMEYLASKQERFGLVLQQAEDEISAINMALGASYAGARAMTATSGGGFSLMVEALGLAGMAELPAVIVLCQRPGPATGFPTRTEQAELLFVVNASQDEFPRFIFAPGDAVQAAHCAVRAVELSQKYQVPAIVLSDQFLADSLWTVGPGINGLAPTAEPKTPPQYEAYTYQRYEITESGISPRLLPGTPQQFVRSTGSEHDESGMETENAAKRTAMMDKRMRKLALMRDEFGAFTCFPDEHEDCVALCFGSTLGPVYEAVEILERSGLRIGMIHLHEIWPFPRERLIARLGRARQLVTVENNATGQLARLIRRETRIETDVQILKCDGRPFTAEEIVARLKGIYRGRV